jgi:uncharacterized RDD family membrane protein YckC
METPTSEIKVNGPTPLEYFKAPFGKRMFAFFFDFILMGLLALGFFAGTRAILENSESYRSAFATYVSVSTDSGLYVYKETDDNLVQITSYYSGETYAIQNQKEEEALQKFYAMDEFFPDHDGAAVYQKQKIGDKRIGASDSLTYFVSNDANEIVANPAYSDEKMHAFYVDAVNNGAQYFNNVDAYVSASKTLSLGINFIIIPSSLALSFLIFEFLIPLIFYRRGWQTFGMKVFGLSLLTSDALSPRFRVFLVRFLWMFFIELLLSMVTFGVPLIVSFSMLAFRKDGQAFHDYMSGTYMVDSSEQSIYLSVTEREELIKKAALTEARTDLLYPNDKKS